MSLGECIPGMVARGELSESRAKTMQAKYDKLLAYYRGQMGEAAAKGEASYRTIEQLEAEAQLRKRQTLLQVAAQQKAMANMATFEKQAPGKWRSAALALFDHDWQGRAPFDKRRRSALSGHIRN